MIYLYTEQKNEEAWIVKNDWYFNMYTGNQALTEQERKIIDEIDHAKVQNDMHIEMKYGVGTIRNLFSGCKTLLNVQSAGFIMAFLPLFHLIYIRKHEGRAMEGRK